MTWTTILPILTLSTVFRRHAGQPEKPGVASAFRRFVEIGDIPGAYPAANKPKNGEKTAMSASTMRIRVTTMILLGDWMRRFFQRA